MVRVKIRGYTARITVPLGKKAQAGAEGPATKRERGQTPCLSGSVERCRQRGLTP